MTWVAVGAIGLVAAAILWAAGVRRVTLAGAAAGLLAGATGYAVQGRPGLPAARPIGAIASAAMPDDLIALRGAMLGQFTGDGAYLIASDAMLRSGARASGVRVVLLGVAHYPRSLTLWTGLGSALAAHDGTLSRPARLAFAQAERLNPLHPAPPFFRGYAEICSGDFRAARRDWAKALALTPRDISYRRDVELRLALLDRFLVQAARTAP